MKPLLFSLLSTIGVVLAVVGLGLVAVGLRRMGQASRSRRWPTVQGTVVSAIVKSRQVPATPDPGEDAEEAAARAPQTVYRPEVTYTYEVDGRRLTGTTLNLEGLELSNEERVRAHAARYAPGQSVTVYYDPAAPERAVLEPGVHAGSWLMPAMGGIFLFVAGGLYLFVRAFSGR